MIRHQGGTHLVSDTLDHVEDSGGKTGLGGEVGEK